MFWNRGIELAVAVCIISIAIVLGFFAFASLSFLMVLGYWFGIVAGGMLAYILLQCYRYIETDSESAEESVESVRQP